MDRCGRTASLGSMWPLLWTPVGMWETLPGCWTSSGRVVLGRSGLAEAGDGWPRSPSINLSFGSSVSPASDSMNLGKGRHRLSQEGGRVPICARTKLELMARRVSSSPGWAGPGLLQSADPRKNHSSGRALHHLQRVMSGLGDPSSDLSFTCTEPHTRADSQKLVRK